MPRPEPARRLGTLGVLGASGREPRRSRHLVGVTEGLRRPLVADGKGDEDLLAACLLVRNRPGALSGAAAGERLRAELRVAAVAVRSRDDEASGRNPVPDGVVRHADAGQPERERLAVSRGFRLERVGEALDVWAVRGERVVPVALLG